MRPEIKSDINDFCENVLLFTDDALFVSDNYDSELRNEIEKFFEIK